jgi:hypothetical protein
MRLFIKKQSKPTFKGFSMKCEKFFRRDCFLTLVSLWFSAFASVYVLVGCDTATGERASSSLPTLELPTVLKGNKFKPLENQIQWFFFPDAPNQAENLFVLASRNVQWKEHPPRTVAGFHWEWEGQSLPQSPAKKSTYATGSAFEWRGFRVSLSDSQTQRWPAVMGRMGRKEGVLTWVGLAQAVPLPLSLQHTLRVMSYSTGELWEVWSAPPAKPCQKGCVTFSSLSSFLDTPVSYGQKRPAFLSTGSLDFFVTSPEPESKNALSALFFSPELVSALQSDWLRFQKNWAQIPAPFVFHASPERDCSYQGLEHARSTLLSFGLGCPERASGDLFLLASHELIHAWNGKLIYPQEHERLDLGGFSKERNRQLYFFEGFTEGLARILAAGQNPQLLSPDLSLKKWNRTLEVLARLSTAEKNLEQHSMASPQAGYEWGSFLALNAVSQALLEGKSRPESLEALIKVLTFLKPQEKSFTFASSDVAWVYQEMQFLKKQKGYTKSNIKFAFEQAFQWSPEHPFLRRYFINSRPFGSQDEWVDELKRISQAVGWNFDATEQIFAFPVGDPKDAARMPF